MTYAVIWSVEVQEEHVGLVLGEATFDLIAADSKLLSQSTEDCGFGTAAIRFCGV